MNTLSKVLSVLTLTLILASAAQAQLINYDQLFADKADQTKERTLANGDTVTDLRLDHGVIITRKPDGSYLSLTTLGTAPACYFEIAIVLTALAQDCPEAFGTNRATALKTTLGKLTAHIARNAYPAQTPEAITTLAQSRITAARKSNRQCAASQSSELAGWLKLADNLTRENGVAVDNLPDMLPVTNPCF